MEFNTKWIILHKFIWAWLKKSERKFGHGGNSIIKQDEMFICLKPLISAWDELSELGNHEMNYQNYQQSHGPVYKKCTTSKVQT